MPLGWPPELFLTKNYKTVQELNIEGIDASAGVDYTKKFASVASDTIMQMWIALTIWHDAEGWTFKAIDIEATFLKDLIEEPTFLEWPPGSVTLGYTSENDMKTKCI